MKKGLKKILALLLAAAMLMALASCGSGGSNNTTEPAGTTAAPSKSESNQTEPAKTEEAQQSSEEAGPAAEYGSYEEILSRDFSTPYKIEYAGVQLQDGNDNNHGNAYDDWWSNTFNVEWDATSLTFENWTQRMNTWLNADDMLIHHSPTAQDNLSVAYVCNDPTLFTTPSNTQEAVPSGYVAKTTLPRASCYPKYEEVDSVTETSFPAASGGSGSTGICDYFYHPGDEADGWYAALFGGDANRGAAAGFGFLIADYRPASTDADFGFRLCRN